MRAPPIICNSFPEAATNTTACSQDIAWKRGDGEGEVIVAVGDDGQLNMYVGCTSTAQPSVAVEPR